MTAEKPINDSVGAMLRARREALGLAQADVAHVVKLPPKRIDALEAERWDELPTGPYLRGFLRNVARALDLDATTLMDRVDASLVRSRSPDSILVGPTATNVRLPRRSGPADDRRGGRALVFGSVAFALIAALIAWSGTGSFDRTLVAGKAMIDERSLTPHASGESVVTAPLPPPATGVAPADPTPAGSSPLVVPAPGTSRPGSAVIGAATVPPVADASAASTLAPVTAPPPAATASSSVSLAFHFMEDAWVEVRSADGKVLLKRLNSAGSEQEVDGQAPFSLIVGNAKGVALRFRGQPVDLGPFTRDQVARLTLS